MRSKHLLVFLMAIALSLALATSAFSAPPRNHHGHHWSDRSPVGYTYLFPQIMGNHYRMPHLFSWGTLRYNKWGQQFEFTFNGFNLERRQEYTLVYYPGDEASMICLGQGSSNRMGQINITGSADICSLPLTEDPNYPDGARIILVPSEDVACEEGVLFEPESRRNLLNHGLVRFTDTDGCPIPEPPVTPPMPPAEEESESSDEGGQITEPEGESDQNEQGQEPAEPEDESGQDDLPYGGMPY